MNAGHVGRNAKSEARCNAIPTTKMMDYLLVAVDLACLAGMMYVLAGRS